MLKNLREQRARAVEQAKAIMARADADKRVLNSDEERSFDGFMAEADTLKAQIERAERMQDEERSLEQSLGRATGGRGGEFATDPHAELRSWLLGEGGRDFSFAMATDTVRANEDVRTWASRAQATTTGAAGGYTVAPEFVFELETALKSFGGARQASRILRTTTGAELPFPTLNDTGNEGRILGEGAEATQQDLAFGNVLFKAHKYTSDIVLVSEELLQDTGFNLAGEIGTALGNRIARITNRHFTVGTGVNQPQGIVTAATLGLVGAAVAGVTYDELVDLEHSVNAAYRRSARFMFADSTLRELKKLRDNDGKLIWQQGMAGGTPDTILGYQYVINDDMPAMGAGAKSILFGDTSKHIIRDVRDVQLRRLNERYAELGSVAFLAFSRHDSRMVDAGTHPVRYFQNKAA
jgi:HK97 family phage major capsid protein